MPPMSAHSSSSHPHDEAMMSIQSSSPNEDAVKGWHSSQSMMVSMRCWGSLVSRRVSSLGGEISGARMLTVAGPLERRGEGGGRDTRRRASLEDASRNLGSNSPSRLPSHALIALDTCSSVTPAKPGLGPEGMEQQAGHMGRGRESGIAEAPEASSAPPPWGGRGRGVAQGFFLVFRFGGMAAAGCACCGVGGKPPSKLGVGGS
mmetsp:Transcript_16341/g.41226  ORF Transcript_16341/g.41226 Transcript_16341/m.41226 type:complete len:204 (+) Transcript_16341:221-832(+)